MTSCPSPPTDAVDPNGPVCLPAPFTPELIGHREALMNVSEYRDDDSQRLGTVSQAPAKFIQICASQNDLFALDEGGNIYQYDFNAKTWVKLVTSRGSMDSRGK